MKTPSKILRGIAVGLAVAGIWSQPICEAQSPAPASQAGTNFTTSVSAEMAAFGSRGVRVHDPSTLIKCNGEYWVFYTGRGVPSWHSRDLTNWEAGPHVFTNAPEWKKEAVPANIGIGFWAPDVIHLGDRYLLYYSISTFGKKVSAIGLATTSTLDPGNPAVWLDRSGRSDSVHEHERFQHH